VRPLVSLVCKNSKDAAKEGKGVERLIEKRLIESVNCKQVAVQSHREQRRICTGFNHVVRAHGRRIHMMLAKRSDERRSDNRSVQSTPKTTLNEGKHEKFVLRSDEESKQTPQRVGNKEKEKRKKKKKNAAKFACSHQVSHIQCERPLTKSVTTSASASIEGSSHNALVSAKLETTRHNTATSSATNAVKDCTNIG
jgi:hypothetical protein